MTSQFTKLSQYGVTSLNLKGPTVKKDQSEFTKHFRNKIMLGNCFVMHFVWEMFCEFFLASSPTRVFVPHNSDQFQKARADSIHSALYLRVKAHASRLFSLFFGYLDKKPKLLDGATKTAQMRSPRRIGSC